MAVTDDDLVLFTAADMLEGSIARSDLLHAERTFWMLLEPSGKGTGVLWQIACGNFTFAAGFTATGIHLDRNEYRASVSLPSSDVKHILVMFVWSPTLLKVLAAASLKTKLDSGKAASTGKLTVETVTPPTFPPSRLIRWARGRIIEPARTYKDERQFRSVVLDVLKSLQDGLDSTGSQASLWDVARKGNAIVGHRPKREIDCQAWVRGQLFNLAIAKNFEISYEPSIGGGSLDALITGVVDGGGLVHACVEFKLAHSTDLEHGIDVQLPEYMRRKACDFGIYFVFDFRCELFAEPKGDLETRLQIRPRRTAEPINVIILECGYRLPPSKMKDPFDDM